VTSNNVPVTLTFVNGNVSPGIDALTTTTFKVNLLFEAFDGAQWKPILDFYDAVATPAANPSPASGPALTQVQVGFYYTAASSGGTQLDTIQTDVNTIKTDINLLKTDSGIVKNDLANLSLSAWRSHHSARDVEQPAATGPGGQPRRRGAADRECQHHLVRAADSVVGPSEHARRHGLQGVPNRHQEGVAGDDDV
jgi:hypothetical protein